MKFNWVHNYITLACPNPHMNNYVNYSLYLFFACSSQGSCECIIKYSQVSDIRVGKNSPALPEAKETTALLLMANVCRSGGSRQLCLQSWKIAKISNFSPDRMCPPRGQRCGLFSRVMRGSWETMEVFAE